MRPLDDEAGESVCAASVVLGSEPLALTPRLGNQEGDRILDVVRSEEHTSELQSHSDLHSFPTRRSSDLSSSGTNLGRWAYRVEPKRSRRQSVNLKCGLWTMKPASRFVPRPSSWVRNRWLSRHASATKKATASSTS